MSARNRDRGIASTNTFKGAQRPQPQPQRTEPQQIADTDKPFKTVICLLVIVFGCGFIAQQFDLNFSFDAFAIYGFFVFGFFTYFIPYFVARFRGHPNRHSILALNFFLGWTFLGWVWALVWSLMAIEE